MPRSLFFVLISLSLIWGGSYFFIKILLEDFGPWTIAFLRSSLGLATIIMIMLISKQKMGLRRIPWIAMTIMALINTAIPWAIIGFSETRLTSSMASVLNAITPLWTVAIGVIFFKSRTNRYKLLGMAVAVLGVIALLDLNPTSIISVDLLGFVCMILASLLYAIGSHLSKRLSNGLTMYQITFGTLLCCMIGSGSMAIATNE
ncbi:DMT family transporter [Aneurinibacillus sp. REN35]|uniref:DMT family transporter n=1 Tax=Aneurinibacillus sp. REN35 TaxID=3237286 RepID=UPI0035293D67